MIRPSFSVTLRVRQQLDERWEFTTIVGGIHEGGQVPARFVAEALNTTEPLYNLSMEAFEQLCQLWNAWNGPLQGTLQAPQSGERAASES